MVTTSKFGLLTIRRHSTTRKHLFPYPQGDRSGLRKPKRISINTNYSYHQLSSPSASLSWSKNGARFSFNQTNRKRWGTKLVNVNYLPHKVFLSWHHKKKKQKEFKWLNQHQVRKICNENSFTLWKQTVFDSPTMEPVVSRHFKITWLSWGSHVLVLHDGQHPKETWNWVHWSKCVIIFMFLLKSMMYVCSLVKAYNRSSPYQWAIKLHDSVIVW